MYGKRKLLKIFSLSVIATSIRFATNFITIKVFAVLISTEGIALLGQLSDFSKIIQFLGSAGINKGVTKYVATYRTSSQELKQLLSTSIRITLVLSLLIGICTLFSSGYISLLLFKTNEYAVVIATFGASIVFYTLNNQLLSIINGHKEVSKYISINIISSVIGLAFTLSLVWLKGLFGALIAYVTYQSITFFITLAVVAKSIWFKFDFFYGRFDKQMALKLFAFSTMSLTTNITTPISQLIVRNFYIYQISIEEAGVWESMNRLSVMMFTMMGSFLSIYYFPKVSEQLSKKAMQTIILDIYKLVIPLLILFLIVVFMMRGMIISLVFTDEFSIMTSLFKWQLLGDFFRILSTVLSFFLLAKSIIRKYIAAELIYGVLFSLLGTLMIYWHGFEGGSIGYCLANMCYFAFLALSVKNAISTS